jgi:hypothetical protein
MNTVIDNIKRFVVVIITELLFAIIGMSLIYVLYAKCSTIGEIINFLNNPTNPVTIVILGIGSIGGGYIGAKMWENLKTNGKEEPKLTEVKPNGQ